jgi:hypothetical protein
MSAKKKSHSVLFTPYLEKGEDLIWVGTPEKNPLFSLGSRTRLINFWLLYVLPLFLTIGIIVFASRLQDEHRDAVQIAISGIYALLVWVLGFFVLGFFRFGKSYYAITTKRLFIVYHHLWKSLDVESLLLLPEHDLQSNKEGTVTIRFAPFRIDEIRFKGKALSQRDRYDDYLTHEEFFRANLENLNSEDAQVASELLEAAKNDVLDHRARALGLME